MVVVLQMGEISLSAISFAISSMQRRPQMSTARSATKARVGHPALRHRLAQVSLRQKKVEQLRNEAQARADRPQLQTEADAGMCHCGQAAAVQAQRLLAGWKRVRSTVVLRGDQRTIDGFVTRRARTASDRDDLINGDGAAPATKRDCTDSAAQLPISN